jgi:hypothetical protein
VAIIFVWSHFNQSPSSVSTKELILSGEIS